jgi:hypothetical protein
LTQGEPPMPKTVADYRRLWPSGWNRSGCWLQPVAPATSRATLSELVNCFSTYRAHHGVAARITPANHCSLLMSAGCIGHKADGKVVGEPAITGNRRLTFGTAKADLSGNAD